MLHSEDPYKIFKDQDTLHKETINYYYQNIMRNKIKSFSGYDNVFNFLEYIKKDIIITQRFIVLTLSPFRTLQTPLRKGTSRRTKIRSTVCLLF